MIWIIINKYIKVCEQLKMNYVIKPINLCGGKGVKVSNEHFKTDLEGLKYSLTLDNPQVDISENSMDFLANGFKLRTSGNGHNTDDATYAYAAFAESPFVTSNGAPGVAG